MLNGLDLFSGIGGITLALSPWVRPIAYCENDRYAQSVLLCRMREGKLPAAPIWDDVRTLRGSFLPSVDIIYGGFPCQDISPAGKRVGIDGARSGLWKHFARIIGEIRPKYVFVENSADLRRRGLDTVLKDLAEVGMDARWCVLSACAVGAPHTRDRLFLLAYAQGLNGKVGMGTWESGKWEIPQERYREVQQNWMDTIWRNAGSGAGLPHRVDRLRALGNSVVPLQAREAFKRLMGIE